ncbi:MAG TPA: tryptophan-rich sensory protein [Nostocaceae cyanobacterium]|nr:tryptophan-rich sensory protein [Nostocaceae cyanobacterium]
MIKSWMIIGAITFLVALGANLITPKNNQWFRRLQRPKWLTFEAAIPLIWIIIFICGAWSAYILWEQDPNSNLTWLMMGLYLLLEIVTLAYTPVMFWERSLLIGTIIGATGFVICFFIAFAAFSVSIWAGLLLFPYLLWSPIGTYTTWEMSQINSHN